MPTKAGAIMERNANDDEEVHRTLRVQRGLWRAALKAAEQEGTTLSDEMRRALERLVKRAERKAAGDC